MACASLSATTVPGIAAADRSRAPQPFVRFGADAGQEGSGLGLSLVAAIARLHRGRLELQSNDPGLRVMVDLPVRKRAQLAGEALTARALLPSLQSFTNCARAGPLSCLASACLLHTLSEGRFTGVAEGAAGSSVAAAAPQASTAMAANAVMIFMP